MDMVGEELRITPDMVEASPGAGSDWMAAIHGFVAQRASEGQTVIVRGVEECLSPAEAGRRLGVSRSSVRRRIEDGSLRAVRRGSRWLIPAQSVNDQIKPEETFSPAEVASMLGVSASTIQRHIADGTLMAVKRGAYWRVLDSEVDRYSHWRMAQVASVFADDFGDGDGE
ncbi:MAG: excisionase family DNA-binding protein [Propionibacteriaceae bacterium]|jgi:excisionase family DNA binding protein|nr:excisionase family DNA-binding protein [Propionibacteriaceae bacterium]